MRAGVVGFILGVAFCVVAAALFQQEAIHDVGADLSFRFSRCVFSEAEFPQGDFEQGRMVHRFLFPSRVTTTFYDAHYQPVTRAENPGRYGAVVRLDLSGNVQYRFITLYRTPARIAWHDKPWLMSVQLPSEIGIDPAVVSAQQAEIGEMLKDSLVGHDASSPNLAILLAGLSETSAGDPSAVARTNVLARDADWWYGLRERLGMAPRYPYLADLPRDYQADPARRWPLMVYLHSGAECGTDLRKVRRTGLPRVVGEGKQLPAIVVSPQCPENEWWNSEALSRVLDEVSAKYRVDPDRIYLTGGSETWKLATAYPGRFAAIVPISGESDPADAARLKDLPVWAFHGPEEKVTPVSRTIEMVDSIRKAGGRPHLTISDGLHDGWEEVYATDSVYTWLLAQKRGQPEVVTPGVPES